MDINGKPRKNLNTSNFNRKSKTSWKHWRRMKKILINFFFYVLLNRSKSDSPSSLLNFSFHLSYPPPFFLFNFYFHLVVMVNYLLKSMREGLFCCFVKDQVFLIWKVKSFYLNGWIFLSKKKFKKPKKKISVAIWILLSLQKKEKKTTPLLPLHYPLSFSALDLSLLKL